MPQILSFEHVTNIMIISYPMRFMVLTLGNAVNVLRSEHISILTKAHAQCSTAACGQWPPSWTALLQITPRPPWGVLLLFPGGRKAWGRSPSANQNLSGFQGLVCFLSVLFFFFSYLFIHIGLFIFYDTYTFSVKKSIRDVIQIGHAPSSRICGLRLPESVRHDIYANSPFFKRF